MSSPPSGAIRPITDEDRPAIVQLLTLSWGSPLVATRGKIVDASALPGLVCAGPEGEIRGFVALRPDGDAWEMMTLDTFVPGQGIGKALFLRAAETARAAGARLLWLVTTNDNVNALGFYQKLGMRITRVHPGAVSESRKLKPEIPRVADNGIPIRDEIELELML
jgi:ribosomal protein S18 acetylase RimI-like enzyme